MPEWHAAAAFRIERARVAPEASPRRMPRSRSGLLADTVEEPAMARLGRDVAGDAMVEGARVGGVEHRGGGARAEPVEDDRDPPHPRRQDRAGHRGEFEPAQPAQHFERVARLRHCGGRRRRRRPRASARARRRRPRCRGRSTRPPRRRTIPCTTLRRPSCWRSPSRRPRARRCRARPPSSRRRWRGRIQPRSSPAPRRCRRSADRGSSRRPGDRRRRPGTAG